MAKQPELTPEVEEGNVTRTKVNRLNGFEQKVSLTGRQVEDLAKCIRSAVETKENKKVLLASKRLYITESRIDQLEVPQKKWYLKRLKA